MAEPMPEPPPMADPRADLYRSPDQVAHEESMREVSETLMNIERAIRRAERAHTAIAVMGRDRNAQLAMEAALEELRLTRKKLFQSTHFGDDQQRLF
jgi:hypothetical protein